MPAEAQSHSTCIETAEPLPSEVAVGSEFVLSVIASCCEGCDLDGSSINVTAPDGTVVTCRVMGRAAGTDATGTITLKAPQSVGQHAWTLTFPPQEIAGIRHEAIAVPVCVRTRPHATSLAVWAIPASVVTGERFVIKVGAKSSADCRLQGQAIEICDHAGAVAACGTLQPSPWPGTSGLYWIELELLAPANEGTSSWSARFEPMALESAHEGTSSQFNVAVVRPPQHTITVKVVQEHSAAPIDNAQIRLGAYRGVTDQDGLAQIMVATGRYDLNVWKVGFEVTGRTVDINDDISLQIEALALPPEDPDAVWQM